MSSGSKAPLSIYVIMQNKHRKPNSILIKQIISIWLYARTTLVHGLFALFTV